MFYSGSAEVGTEVTLVGTDSTDGAASIAGVFNSVPVAEATCSTVGGVVVSDDVAGVSEVEGEVTLVDTDSVAGTVSITGLFDSVPATGTVCSVVDGVVVSDNVAGVSTGKAEGSTDGSGTNGTATAAEAPCWL